MTLPEHTNGTSKSQVADAKTPVQDKSAPSGIIISGEGGSGDKPEGAEAETIDEKASVVDQVAKEPSTLSTVKVATSTKGSTGVLVAFH